MQWYLAVLGKYAVFQGRAQRREYWMFLLCNLVVLGVFLLWSNSSAGNSTAPTGWAIIYLLAMWLPGTAVAVRRLHDTGRSGWWVLIVLVPLVGTIALFTLLALDGQVGTNAYGPDPKAAGTSAIPQAPERAPGTSAAELERQPPGGVTPVMAGTKKCPYCAEMIKAEAIKCRYCLSDLAGGPAGVPGPVNESAPSPPAVEAPEVMPARRVAGSTLVADLPGGATIEFVWIEPGTFTMGDATLGQTQRHVTIGAGYYLARTELTQGQWTAVMGTSPWVGRSNVQANCPAVYISWHDVQGLVQTLNQSAGETLYRLPTEAEWEYACRAGTTTRWSFGNDEGQLGLYGWYYESAWRVGLQWAQPVGTKLPNPWGLYDMHGNVWEWVQDWYGSYSSGAQMDPQGPVTGSDRVSRGGNFSISAEYTRSAIRHGHAPDNRGNHFGARLLRTR